MRRVKKKKQKYNWQDKTAEWVAHKVIAIQIFISCFLQKQERKLSVKQKKSWLAIFCLISGAYLLYLLWGVLYQEPPQHLFYPSFPESENVQPQKNKDTLLHKQPKPFNHRQNKKP